MRLHKRPVLRSMYVETPGAGPPRRTAAAWRRGVSLPHPAQLTSPLDQEPAGSRTRTRTGPVLRTFPVSVNLHDANRAGLSPRVRGSSAAASVSKVRKKKTQLASR